MHIYTYQLLNSQNHPYWMLTSFYGFLERGRRKDPWTLFFTPANDTFLPQCVIGDFNDLLSNDEKIGLIDHLNWLLIGFIEVINDYNHCIDEMNIWGKHLQRQFREQIGTCRTDLEFLHHSQTLDDGIQYQAFSDHNGIFDVDVSYFQNLFQSGNRCNDFLLVVNKVFACVSSYDNYSLLATFTIDEFKNALFLMDSNKSPGPNGLNPTF